MSLDEHEIVEIDLQWMTMSAEERFLFILIEQLSREAGHSVPMDQVIDAYDDPERVAKVKRRVDQIHRNVEKRITEAPA